MCSVANKKSKYYACITNSPFCGSRSFSHINSLNYPISSEGGGDLQKQVWGLAFSSLGTVVIAPGVMDSKQKRGNLD